MSRLARTISGSGVYHILFRGVNQQNIFEENADYEKLKETILNVKEDLNFEIYAYCFMSNHVHIVLKEKNNNRKNSLQDLKVTEMTVLKEFFVYLRNTKNTSAALRYIEKVKPLDIDAALLNDYISELVLGNVSQALIDEVETLYEENEYSIERMREVGVIGNTNILFDIGEIFDCIQQIEDFVGGNAKDDNFTIEFPKLVNQIDDEDVAQNFYEVVELCEQFSSKKLGREEFVATLSNVLFELKSIYRFCENDFIEE